MSRWKTEPEGPPSALFRAVVKLGGAMAVSVMGRRKTYLPGGFRLWIDPLASEPLNAGRCVGIAANGLRYAIDADRLESE